MNRKPRILIDAGHGGTDPGATSARPIEAYLNLRITKKLEQALQQAGFNVRLTRDGHDQTVTLDERVMIEHTLVPDATISLHCNSFKTEKPNGFEIYTSPGETESDPLATTIYRAFKRRWPEQKLRADLCDGDPDKESRFRILTGTIGPAVLVEFGFLSNPKERDWLLHDHTQEQLAINLADAISDWWKLQVR